MKKKLLAVLLAGAMMAASLTACGGSSASSEAAAPASSEAAAPAEESKEEAPASEEAPAEEAPAAYEGEPIAVSFAHNVNPAAPWSRATDDAIAWLAEQSGGKFVGTNYPSGQLFQGDWQKLFEMCQTNSIQVGIEGMMSLGAINPHTNFLCMPFLFENEEQVNYFFNDPENTVWQRFMDEFQDNGVVILGVCPRPMRQISNTKHECAKLEDFGDLTLRAPSNDVIVATMEALGIRPIPMASGEIYQAIQLGTVMGEDNAIGQQYEAKTFELVKYFTICNYIADGSTMFCSKDFYDSLSDDEKTMFHDMAHLWCEKNIEYQNDYVVEAREYGEAQGIKFTEMSKEEQARCAEACKGVWESVMANYSQEDLDSLMAAVDRAKANA